MQAFELPAQVSIIVEGKVFCVLAQVLAAFSFLFLGNAQTFETLAVR